jgi:hypothetical protein
MRHFPSRFIATAQKPGEKANTFFTENRVYFQILQMKKAPKVGNCKKNLDSRQILHQEPQYHKENKTKFLS